MASPRRFCAVCGQGPLAARRCPNRMCSWSGRSFSVAFAVGVHQGRLRRAITRYKYRGERCWVDAFTGMLAAYIETNAPWFEEFELVVAVPAYTGAGARRSWDPVGQLVANLSSRLPAGGWDVRPDLVVKRSETPGMAGRSWAERQAIAAGPLRRSLAVADVSAVRGRSVLVVDDVLTEGSTLSEMGRVLRRAGAADVAGLVLARPAWDPLPPLRSPAR